MAQTMAPSVPIDTQSSQPAEREKYNLPLKSYADAAEHEPEKVNGINNTPPFQFIGKGEADVQRSPPFSQPRHRKSGSLRKNEASKRPRASDLVTEEPRDQEGEQLTTTKLTFDGPAKPQRTQTELVSGRRAGARWERSQYVGIPNLYSNTHRPV